MPKVIECSLWDKESINNAIKELKTFRKGLEDKVNLFTELLGRYGLTVINAGYASAVTDGSDDGNIQVSMKNDKKGIVTITASGNSVLFIEFGTGIRYPESEARKELITDDVLMHGQYGSKKGSNPKGWWYSENGSSVHTYGIPAQNIVYNGMNAIKAKVEEVAEEVFFND